MVELLTLVWLFNTSQPAQSTLTAQASRAEFAMPSNATNTFTVKFTVDLKKFGGKKDLLEIPSVLSVRLRQHDPLDRNRQNYPAFKMPDGSVPVLEANLVLHSAEHPDWKNMQIGIPLAVLKRPEGEHEIVLNFTGVCWTMYVDGELLDNDFPFGHPQWAGKHEWKLDAEYVKRAAIYFPGIEPRKKQAKIPRIAPSIQYWIPPGHNNWVGDVVTFFYQGRYHVFYLYDRRHHQSKFGCGAHYFEHISTQDFKTWTEHEAATPLEEQWECIGTGTPFVFNNRLCISYGMHTTRVYPQEKTTLPVQWEYLTKNGRTGEFKRATTPGIPAGSTYAVSADGVSNFKKSHIMFHPCENPSVYIDPSGKLRMMANYHSKGIWESETVDGGWHCISPGFPPGGDCTFFFRCGKYDYIIGGFAGLWSKSSDAPDSAYEDVVRKGLDFYDGSAVPSITEVTGGRFLMAAWIPIRGWGGNLLIRELLQFPDGRIGSKWLKEITPETEKPRNLTARIAKKLTIPSGNRSFMLVFNVQPADAKKGRFAVSFMPESGEQASCELQVRLDDLRAQFGPGSLSNFAGKEKSLREGGGPNAIENLIGVDKPFTVRVIVKGDDKMGGSLVDAEIAGQRTMISYRADLTVKKLAFRVEGVILGNVQIAPLRNQEVREPELSAGSVSGASAFLQQGSGP
jgi:beta-fructofuranosidase